ncbi:TIGR02530 family flagellar biosynthesis protein [Pelovirga terrestris]|uniref:Flagellar protein n=1 Tax=Pelovirga terrestris TaxID=2771352 RepID=A0A8J6QN03_9BACT|nr:TIGR02530 family flagellar biosynthesis protein [Pelovirga terrestris]MBD1400432.1 flagellar protein [Pelovirga terrestris]
MTDAINIFPQPVFPGGQPPAKRPDRAPATGTNFDALLRNKMAPQNIKFSRHAGERMQSRGITFNPQQLQRLESAIEQINLKGGRESLVMLDDTALVVSVKNDTVVTVVSKDQLKNNVFTNIDSAVIA